MAFVLFDEHLGQSHRIGDVRFVKPRITIRELIRARVELEIERHDEQRAIPSANPLPRVGALGEIAGVADPAHRADGCGSMFLRIDGAKDHRRTDRLVKAAEEGFRRGRYFILLDDWQAEDLDQAIDLDRTDKATFLLLTPLQGG